MEYASTLLSAIDVIASTSSSAKRTCSPCALKRCWAIASITRIARTFVDRCIVDLVAGKLDTETASMAKLWTTDMQQQVLDDCVQLHGGYGYMNEYLVCRLFADSRVQRIYGGTNEIMKEVIARGL